VAGSRIAAACFVAVVCLWAAPAQADRVDDLARQLTDDPDYKVRLSAALNLGRLGDRRGVGPLTSALGDSDKTVRGVAAATLGKLVDAQVAEPTRTRIATELGRLAADDPDSFVRSQAARSAATIRAIRTAPATRGVYVEIGPLTDASKRGNKDLIPGMRRKLAEALGQKLPSLLSVRPSESELSRIASFYVDGTVTSLTVQKGPPASVVCKVKLLLATYPGKSMFAFLDGGGEASSAGTSERAIAEAASECVEAVVEDMAGKLVPQIQARSAR
jgi:HEAT repeats